jgi:hypothetical protein
MLASILKDLCAQCGAAHAKHLLDGGTGGLGDLKPDGLSAVGNPDIGIKSTSTAVGHALETLVHGLTGNSQHNVVGIADPVR